MASASENGTAANPGEESHEPRECMPCRGSGRVISNLDGTSKDVTCPWCEGSGSRLAGVDAQAHWPDAPPEQRAGAEPMAEPDASQGRDQPETRSRSTATPKASKSRPAPDRA